MGRTPLVQRINNNTKNHTRPPITMAFGGIALKSVSLFFRAIEFGCAAVIIGIFSYYLATLTDHSLPISVHTLPRLTCARATLLIRLLLVVSRQSTSMVMRPRMEMRLLAMGIRLPRLRTPRLWLGME